MDNYNYCNNNVCTCGVCAQCINLRICNVCGYNPCRCADMCGVCNCCECICETNCCKLQSYNLDQTKLKTVCTNMDVIYDTCCAQGTPLVLQLVDVSDPEFDVEVQYQSCSSYNTCIVDENSVFTVDSSKVKIISFSSVDPVLASEVLIGGKELLSLTDQNNSYRGVIDPTVNDSNCNECGYGTKASAVINGIDNWEITLQIQLSGKVTTAQGTCKFDATFTTAEGVEILDPTSVTFVCNDLCLPSPGDDDEVNVGFKFKACAQIINPRVNIETDGDPLSLNGTLLITPNARVEITKNTTVCFYGTTE